MKSKQLTAINRMLGAIGEMPVANLSSTDDDAANALRILDEETEELLEKGWSINTDTQYPLTPDLNGEIRLASNMLKLSPDGESSYRRLFRRGDRLYDADEQTFTFEQTVTCKVVWGFDFDDLPVAYRTYITIAAGRRFQQEVRGGQVSDMFSQEAEARALIELKHAEADTDYASLRDSNDISDVLGDRYRDGID